MKKFIATIFVLTYLIASSYGQNLVPVYQDGIYTYANSENKKLSKKEFVYAEPFSEGFAVVFDGHKFGLIDEEGDMIMDFVYNNILGFYEGYACAQINGLWGYINKNGVVQIALQYSDANSFNDGLAKVSIYNPEKDNFNNSVGYINMKGELISDVWFTSVSEFKGDIAIATIDTNFYYLHRDGSYELTNDFRIAQAKDVEIMESEYPYGEVALKEFIKNEVEPVIIDYSEHWQFKAAIKFAVTKSGNIEHFSVKGGVNSVFDREALRVAKQMGEWTPAIQFGKIVNSWQMVDVPFEKTF